jgi:hypothetical protein
MLSTFIETGNPSAVPTLVSRFSAGIPHVHVARPFSRGRLILIKSNQGD